MKRCGSTLCWSSIYLSVPADVACVHKLLDEAEELLPVVGDDVHPGLDLLLHSIVCCRELALDN